ncbi:MAG: hydrogenase expression/formation protein HypE [Gammaproteobacteria bacterium]|nr:hydrogenase expression/formation protein HypE [Gammaproteobacteria bacterium]
MNPDDDPKLSCPLPLNKSTEVLLAHGGGGTHTHELIERLLLPAFDNPALRARHDGAVLTLGDTRLAFSTDTYVVRPSIFPGGDIGSLAVNGTVNDLAMCGARPLYLSVGLILEEGLDMSVLERIVHSMRDAAQQANVMLVTGDTKVVDRGHGDGVFINTTGIGVVEHTQRIGPTEIADGDVVLLSGDIGRHGMAVMSAREGLAFETPIHSDTTPLAGAVKLMLDAGTRLHCLRDPTRGGLATSLVEIAEVGGWHIEVQESHIPVHGSVQAACDLLGFDPLYVANEGRLLAIVPAAHASSALGALRTHPACADAQEIGRVRSGNGGRVTLITRLGTTRGIDRLSGEQLPRIC